jgi:hypothetical protein
MNFPAQVRREIFGGAGNSEARRREQFLQNFCLKPAAKFSLFLIRKKLRWFHGSGWAEVVSIPAADSADCQKDRTVRFHRSNFGAL